MSPLRSVVASCSPSAMSAALSLPPPLSLEEFLAWGPRQEWPFEWDGVQPVAMVGGNATHSELGLRVHDAPRAKLAGGPCRVFRSATGVLTAGGSRLRYPDLVVTCAAVGGRDQVAPDPVFILEVLSESTAAVDRGVKRAEYAALPSLARYVMLAQDAPIALICDRAAASRSRRSRWRSRCPSLA